MQNNLYPSIHIRSKNELARHLSDRKLSVEQALVVINDVLNNYNKYWVDHKKYSQPEKGKWVRDASRSRLGTLLKLINERVLTPHDKMLPYFIYGGVSEKNHVDAVKQLLGTKRSRILLKLDISKFFEQIRYERVEQFFAQKAECGEQGSKLFADLCCVPVGAKDDPGEYKTIARGYSTSSRLAVWCNLETFLKVESIVKRTLRGKDPRIAIYVDDIGITASKVSVDQMIRLYHKITKVLESDKNQILPLNHNKTKIVLHSGDTYNLAGDYEGKWAFEFLGLQMNRNSLSLGSKTRWKRATLIHKLKTAQRSPDVKRAKGAIDRYNSYITK